MSDEKAMRAIFMQLWSPTVIHLSFIQNIQAKKTRSSTTNVSPEEPVGMFFNMVEPTESRKSLASLPYIKGVTEPLTRILKKHDVTLVNKPFTTLQEQFPAPKFRSSMEWKIGKYCRLFGYSCNNCLASEVTVIFSRD